jgi:sugar/nucleoside kinase (ribokinase family)
MNSKPFINEELDEKIIHTMGELGCQHKDKTYPVKHVEIKNLSGAGDSFLAALVVKYLESKDLEESIKFANDSATIVVQKAGMATIGEEYGKRT